MDRDEKPRTTIDMTFLARCELAHREVAARTNHDGRLLDPELAAVFTAIVAIRHDGDADPVRLSQLRRRRTVRCREIQAEVFARHGITEEQHETWFENELVKSIMGDAELWKRLRVDETGN